MPRMPAALATLAALLLGAATVFSFSPFGASLLPALTLAGLFALWRTSSPGRAFALGLAFGLGLFAVGVSWVYIALNTFGDMPALLAALGTAVFCAYLALFPALTGWITARTTACDSIARLMVAAAAWTLSEWLRGWLFSGFGWLSVGYTQVATPLAGYAPIGGVLVPGLLLALTAAVLADAVTGVDANGRRLLASTVAVAIVWASGYALTRVDWSHPVGEPTTVSLLQGNIGQDLKFEPSYREKTFAIYADLVAKSRGRLIVLPESALPVFADEVPPEYVALLRSAAQHNGGDLLLGLFFFEPRASVDEDDRYYNSVVTVGTAAPQVYRKHHLVPFGETIPLKPVFGWFIRNVLAIPLADQTPGAAYQEPFVVAGQRLAVNICYEDAFGGELARRAADATLMVNVTNDAWYGHSLAAEQHDQIAAMRALETARPMLRATNTGITSIIDHHGVESSRLPWFTRGVLEGTIAGRQGVTPYVRFGDALVVALALLIIATTLFLTRRFQRMSLATFGRDARIQ
ncbi:MAG: apolipoprotein N-acyltransferase [Betaproteobacteria bacterium]|nr:MAG: apolipoprotein N-acyltransferase [Betaproteobacteria bacterium]